MTYKLLLRITRAHLQSSPVLWISRVSMYPRWPEIQLSPSISSSTSVNSSTYCMLHGVSAHCSRSLLHKAVNWEGYKKHTIVFLCGSYVNEGVRNTVSSGGECYSEELIFVVSHKLYLIIRFTITLLQATALRTVYSFFLHVFSYAIFNQKH